MVETLKIEITANNKAGVAALKETSKALDNLDMGAKKASNAVGNFARVSAQADAQVKKSKGNYTELSRVIQDLPFGFTAISNNLTQLIPGVGALGLAFSGLVAALTFSQVGFTAWGAKTKKAKEEADELNKAIAEETVGFQTLYRAATNANAPLEARGRAVKDLRDQYGNYLKNFSDEEIMAGKATSAYNALSESILKVARAKAAQDKITELFTKRLAEEGKLAAIAAKAEKQAADNAARRAQRGDISLRQQELGQGIESSAVTFARASQEALKVANAIGEIDKEIARLNTTIDNNQVKPFTEETKKVASDFNRAAFEAERLNTALQDRLSLTRPMAGGGIQQSPIDRSRPQQGQLGQASETGFQRLVEFQRGLMATDEALRLYNEYAAESAGITGVFSSSFTDLSNALLQGQSIGDALGNVFRKLAADIAAAAIKALIFKSILGALTGGTSAALGGLAGANTSFGSIFGRFLGLRMAEGGITQGPTPALIGEAGPEAVLPLDKLGAFVDRAAKIGANSMGGGQNMNLNGEWRLQGQDLVLALQRAEFARNLRR